MHVAPWPAVPEIAYGGDYNPEQWPREVWDEDVRLMREAGVTLVSVGIFSWGLIETSAGEFDFSWMDELLDLLHAHGIAVDLGTPTASPPAWFFHEHPESRIVTADGSVIGFGSRGMVSHSSPAYRAAIVRYADALAERYATHPAVAMWHVHNEYGAPVGEDFSPASVSAWRSWLRDRYETVDAVNAAWGTAFWGQHYTQWDHIGAPALTGSVPNPAQKLDWARFTDAMLRECFVLEREAIRRHSDKPVTTNFMANQTPTCDLWAWASEVDVVSDDHYLVAADTEAEIHLAIAADLTRSLAGGKPWMLLEHSTSAVNWQPRNVAKRAGEMARNSFSHLGRGADAVMFFQWRAGRSGAEKFHSAMLPHAGTRSRVWREVVQLGADLHKLAELRDSRTVADVAMLWDFQSMWAQDLEWRPSVDVTHAERIRAFYERLWRDGLTVDFALPGHDLSSYPLVVVPAQYLLRRDDAANLTRYVENGGTLLVSFFSAAVDENDRVHEGGFLAPLGEALGVVVDEYLPRRSAQTHRVRLADGTMLDADVWAEDLHVTTAETVGTYVGGPADGAAALTRNAHGSGHGWYVSTRLSADTLDAIMPGVYADAGMNPRRPERGLELIRRRGDEADYVIAINHADTDATVEVDGIELLRGTTATGTHVVSGGGVAVIRTSHRADDGGEDR